MVDLSNVLEYNFEWTERQSLPYEVLDELRRHHGIDTTGLNLSLTHRGNLYRSYALYQGR